MAGQGKITKQIALSLISDKWNVVYTCIPNTPHINVVPIPIEDGASKQRYPDIVAYKGNLIKFIEVEVKLTESVSKDILLRFNEYTTALNDPIKWSLWKSHIFSQTGHKLPYIFLCEKDLIICETIRLKSKPFKDLLETQGIQVYNHINYKNQSKPSCN